MDDKPVLIISDTHAPYHHAHALEFLKNTYDAYGCGRVVHIGDLFDFHYGSRHKTELDAYNFQIEYDAALEFSAQLTEVFPKGTLILGNHDLIPWRQLQEVNIGQEVLKSKNDIFGLPKTWDIKENYHVLNFPGWESDVLCEHGVGSNGMYGAINTAIAKRCSFVMGHAHSFASVNYRTNYKDTIFGLNVGCLADSGSLSQRYGKYFKFKQVTGCGVVFNPEMALFEKMRESDYE